MKKAITCTWLFLPLAILWFCGCSSVSTEMSTGFLEDYTRLTVGKYFKQEHISSAIDFSKYDSVKVAPVDFDYLIDKTSCSADDLENLGRDFRKNIEDELAKKGFTVTSSPTAKTLVICAAITNIELPNVAVNVAAGLLSPIPVPLPLDTDGATAFEMKIVDSRTGAVLIQAAEKQSGSGEGLDLAAKAVGGYINFVNTKAVFKNWAGKIAKMLEDLKKNP